METQRIAVLEKQLQKLQVTVLSLVGLVVIVGVLAIIGPASAKLQVTDLLQVRELQVVDENGAILAKIMQDTNGGQLQIYNKSNANILNAFVDDGGRPILDIGTPGYRGKLRLINTPGDNTVELGVRDNETGFFKIKDANGIDAVWINSEGSGGLVRWNNTKGETAGFLGTNPNGGIVGVHGNDEEGTSPRLFAGTNLFNGTGVVEVIGSNGKTTFLTSTFENTPYLSLKNQAGITAINGTATGRGGSISGYNGEGNEKFRNAVSRDGHGYTLLKRADGITTHFVGSTRDGRPIIDLKNPAGGSLYIAEEDSTTGKGILKTYDPDGTLLWKSSLDSTTTGDAGGDSSTGGGDTTSGLLGDLDNDGDVDFSDFISFASNFGKRISG
ncbi:MAG: hypothetical protein HOH77_22405 [Candidatus Latescibacteria bacterium]|jgi:hypothetical protein|nr:hypothetical protein [Candidatus Latescibacterota bacterium]